MSLLEDYIKDCFGEERMIEIIDLGGTESFWKTFKTPITDRANITLVNLTYQNVTEPNFKSIIGNACRLPQFTKNQFDLVFSNSVIEHVGNFEKQKEMANEIKRIGKYYFIQTPNQYFFLEPHFLLPFFQFLPVKIKVFLITHWNIGQYKKETTRENALKIINSVHLLSIHQFKKLFPGSHIYYERFFGLVKSFVAYK